ncbi:hypothetical protein [Blautia sp. MSK.21.1]|nr:hypothetical protein [Blautia sp. MSK.21.1]NSY30129.1 hypothetical protein [Blautia sp. MSK.21.1]
MKVIEESENQKGDHENEKKEIGETMSYTEWQGAPHSETIKKNRHST